MLLPFTRSLFTRIRWFCHYRSRSFAHRVCRVYALVHVARLCHFTRTPVAGCTHRFSTRGSGLHARVATTAVCVAVTVTVPVHIPAVGYVLRTFTTYVWLDYYAGCSSPSSPVLDSVTAVTVATLCRFTSYLLRYRLRCTAFCRILRACLPVPVTLLPHTFGYVTCHYCVLRITVLDTRHVLTTFGSVCLPVLTPVPGYGLFGSTLVPGC